MAWSPLYGLRANTSAGDRRFRLPALTRAALASLAVYSDFVCRLRFTCYRISPRTRSYRAEHVACAAPLWIALLRRLLLHSRAAWPFRNARFCMPQALPTSLHLLDSGLLSAIYMGRYYVMLHSTRAAKSSMPALAHTSLFAPGRPATRPPSGYWGYKSVMHACGLWSLCLDTCLPGSAMADSAILPIPH